MKKVIVMLLFITGFQLMKAQVTKQIAVFQNGSFDLKLTQAEFELIHNSKISGIFNSGSTFISAKVDDPDPNDQIEVGYLLFKFNTIDNTTTFGLKLKKTIADNKTVYNLSESTFQRDDEVESEIDGSDTWECSTPKDCDGCIPKRVKRQVIGCKCPNGNAWCAFKTSGNSGGNFPTWTNIIALVIALFGFIK